MEQIMAMICFYGGCVEEVSIFNDEETLAAAFEKAVGVSYDDYMKGKYTPDLEGSYVECHFVHNELGCLDKNQVVQQLASVAQSNIMELSDRNDLESRNNDSEDFFTTSVWDLKAALLAAYNLGKEQAQVSPAKKTSLDSRIESATSHAVEPHSVPTTKSKAPAHQH